MPYILTTMRPCSECRAVFPYGECTFPDESYRAVATLEEARIAVQGGWTRAQVEAAIPESGGTVGPLPDGTVIEVEWVTTIELAAAARVTNGQGTREIIDAWNAAHA